MEITKKLDGTSLTIALAGRLDAATAMDLDKELNASLTGVKDLTFDLAALDYIASAGLRTLLAAQKRMNKQGSMKLTNVKSEVHEVLEMTGFVNFLTIE